MNEFLPWVMAHNRPWDARPPLNAQEHDELFVLMAEPSLPANAMSAEMADGYITACVVGPAPVPVPHWLEAIFAQPTLPLPHDAERQQRLLQLLLRRHADITASTAISVDKAKPHNIFVPLIAHIPDEDRITPYRLDAKGQRMGAWDLQDWAQGFRLALVEDDDWEPLLTSADAPLVVSPVVLYTLGHNPDDLSLQIGEEDNLFARLVASVCAMRNWWRAYNRQAGSGAPRLSLKHISAASVTAPVRSVTPKPGRNDPCVCGSGKKYKKCCGA